ncbi:hypothetical protein EVAR_51409_1 [Eumeta japonica]|uniref:Uncharacterized protein n=1 Tax=Eumeta variegata TaxID=151549 RepID=A0A4C1XUW6_EUMVA|nr:hypothetical protein EVAR_51409_1 [Eumeta japonica]
MPLRAGLGVERLERALKNNLAPPSLKLGPALMVLFHNSMYFLRRCPNAETLSRHESPDWWARGDYVHAVTLIQPMPPRGELLN